MRSLLLRRGTALVSLVAFVGLILAGSSHLLVNDDPGCAQDPLAPHHEITGIGVAIPTHGPLHCTLCHWLRTFSGARTSAPIAVVASTDCLTAVPARPIHRARAHAASGRSSRAPPSSLLS